MGHVCYPTSGPAGGSASMVEMNSCSGSLGRCAVVVAMVMVAAPSVAGAAERDPAAEGIRLRREGKDQEALPLFEAALRDHPGPRAYAQLGTCEQALGLWVLAEEHLQQGLKNTRDPWIQRNQTALREALAFVQGRIGSVEVWGTPRGAEVSIDGQVVGQFPLAHAVRVAQGRRILKVTADRNLPHTRSIDVTAGVPSREHVALVEDGTANAASPVPPAIPRAPLATSEEPADPAPADAHIEVTPGREDVELSGWRRVLPWSLLGVAVVAGSIGVWEHLRSNSSYEAFQGIVGCGALAPMRGSDRRCSGLYDQFISQQRGAYIGYGVGAVLGLTAVTLFIINANTSPAAQGVQARIFGGPGTAGLSVSTVF